MKRIISALMALAMVFTLAISVRAAERPTDAYARKMLQYYQHYQEEARPEIDHYLSLMEQEEPSQAALWKDIMGCWAWADQEMPLYADTLPDGLPQDDSLCIVVLGYGLTANGAMKPELLDRLEVAQASAEKYPNAWLLLTGGETAHVPGVSEAGEMRSWLVDRGVDVGRIIMDTEALSTTENARNSCRILSRYYPQVTTLALVTSDYHCRWGASLLSVAALLESGDMQVVCSAYCKTDIAGYDSYQSQAWGIALLAGVAWDGASAPELYLPRETQSLETAAAQIRMTEPETELEREKSFLWLALPVCAVLCLGVVLAAKKKKEPLS